MFWYLFYNYCETNIINLTIKPYQPYQLSHLIQIWRNLQKEPGIVNKTGYLWSWSQRLGHASGRSSQDLFLAAQESSAASAGTISWILCLRRVHGASKRVGSSLYCSATHRTAGPKSQTWSLAAPTTQSRTTGTQSCVTNAVSCAKTWTSIWTAALSSTGLMTRTMNEKTFRSAC